jgi:hypothetical protein
VNRREANIFACLTDTVVAPATPLPPVGATDAVDSFADYLRRSPAGGRLALRGALLALEVAPRLMGFGARLRSLDPPRRAAFMVRAEASPLAPMVVGLRGVAQLSYYGDAGVMRLLGYDAEARVARGRALRAAEGRW